MQIGANGDGTLPQDEFGDILRILEPDFFTFTRLTDLFADDDLTTDGRVNVARLLHQCGVAAAEIETDVKEYHAASTKQNETTLFGNLPSELDGNKSRVLFVSENLPMAELLVEAAKDGTVVVPVKYNSWTLDDLTENTLKRLGVPKKQFASIALMDHGKQGSFCLLKSVGEQDGMVNLKTIQANPGLQNFFKLLGQYVHKSELQDFRQDLNSRIDLLACDVAAGDGPKLVEYLEDVTQVNWAASTNPTGTTKGSDWVMETEKGLGAINNCYFDNEKLAKWNYECGFWEDLAGVAVGVGTGLALAAAAPVLLPAAAVGGVAAGVGIGVTAAVAGSAASLTVGVQRGDEEYTEKWKNGQWKTDMVQGAVVGGATGGVASGLLSAGVPSSVSHVLPKNAGVATKFGVGVTEGMARRHC